VELTKTQKAAIKDWQKNLPPGTWRLDPVLLHNAGTKLWYRGGLSGSYIEFTTEGEFIIGIYDHAYDGITDGILTPFLTLDISYTDADHLIKKLIS